MRPASGPDTPMCCCPATLVAAIEPISAGAPLSTMNGMNALQAFSQAQAVKLSYNDQGQITDHGSTDSAQQILDLVTKDWGYSLNMADLTPNDPVVNTASEYMFEMGAISHHTLTGKTTVVLAADVTAGDGTVVKAGTYEYQNEGKYYSQFDRTNPIEGAARGQLWSGTALALIGQLGVGAVTANTLTIGLGLVGVISFVTLRGLSTALAESRRAAQALESREN